MERVNVIWVDEFRGHFHVYVSLDGRGAVVLFVDPQTHSAVFVYEFDKFVERLPEVLRKPFLEAYRRLAAGRGAPRPMRAVAAQHILTPLFP